MTSSDIFEMYNNFRRSKILAAVAFFIANFTDAMAVALVMSLSPDIIRSMNYVQCYCSGTTAETNFQKVSSIDNPINDTKVYFCPKRSNGFPTCLTGKDVLVEIVGSVDLMNAVGPLAELAVNPLVVILCSKYGHRIPFLVGAAIQITSSFVFLFAPNEVYLISARGIQGMASTTIFISGLLMVNNVFDENERTKVISSSIGMGFPLASLFVFSIGNLGYQRYGVVLPMGILVAFALIDGLIRLFLDTEKHEEDIKLKRQKKTGLATKANPHNKDKPVSVSAHADPNAILTNGDAESRAEEAKLKQTQNVDKPKDESLEGSYKELLCDVFIIEALIVGITQGFILYLVFATAPNWSINVLRADQWQLGIVLAVGAGVQLLYAIFIGGVISRRTVWVYLLIGLCSLVASLLIYPQVPSVWFALIPEAGVRGIVFNNQLVILPNFMAFAMEERHRHSVAKGFSLYNICYTIGCGLGPFTGSLLKYISFMELYYISAGVCAFLLFFPLHWFIAKPLSKP